MSASKFWNISMLDSPGSERTACQEGMCSESSGTTRGSPRRSRTAKASRISRYAVKSRCAREWGGWGRLSDDGPGHYNPDPSEGPWGRWSIRTAWRCMIESSGPTSERTTVATTKCTKGGCKLDGGRRMPGAGLSRRSPRKAPLGQPAFQPYWGKLAVRNDRGDRRKRRHHSKPDPRLDPTRPPRMMNSEGWHEGPASKAGPAQHGRNRKTSV